MADNTSQASSALNPAAATFTMPSTTKESSATTNGEQPVTPTTNGQTKKDKQKRPDQSNARTTTAEDIAEAGAGVKLTGAQLKKQKMAEKAARRAEKVAEKGVQAQTPQQPQPSQSTGGPSVGGSTDVQRRQSQSARAEGEGPHHRRTPSMAGGRALPIRPPQGQPVVQEKEKPKEEKRVAMFSHLYTREKRASLVGAGKEVHPAVLALGLQLRDYVICGGSARCIAMLLVFKRVIQAYTTPPGVALSRHLTTHLSHQISYLSQSRPLSVSQGNSIRWLKKLISALDPDLAEGDAKSFLCSSIDQFIRERLTLADEVIAREANDRIVDGDVILTYAKSSVVEKSLLTAHRSGKKFRVIVVDSRPLFEGRNHARSLVRAGLDVQYCLLSAIADVLDEVTKCFLGAAAMLGNGRLSSRAGTAMVAMMAKETTHKIPIIVLCQTVKFTARVALDSVIMNELGDADALVEPEQSNIFTTTAPPPEPVSAKGGGKKKEESNEDKTPKKGLDGWKDQPNLYLLSLMYDVTPAEYLDMVICELGSLPPQAVPVVNGVHGGDE